MGCVVGWFACGVSFYDFARQCTITSGEPQDSNSKPSLWIRRAPPANQEVSLLHRHVNRNCYLESRTPILFLHSAWSGCLFYGLFSVHRAAHFPGVQFAEAPREFCCGPALSFYLPFRIRTIAVMPLWPSRFSHWPLRVASNIL